MPVGGACVVEQPSGPNFGTSVTKLGSPEEINVDMGRIDIIWQIPERNDENPKTNRLE
jgi:hypothetical protein